MAVTKPQVNVTAFDRFLLNHFPERAAKRMQRKAATAFAMSQMGEYGVGVTGYNYPTSSKTSMRRWAPRSYIPDAEFLPKAGRIRAGARDLWMNSPIATAALRRFQTNVVGFGLTLQSTVDWEYLGMSKEQARKLQKDIEREWLYYSQSKECDARRSHDFYDLQALVCMSEMMSGDCFVFLPYIERPGCDYGLKIQVVESDFISNPAAVMDTLRTAGGVEVEPETGAPVAYWLKKLNPDHSIDAYDNEYDSLNQWVRIPAFGERSGKRNVLHLFKSERPGQRRGIPLLAPVIEPLKQLERFTESELQAAVVTSFYTVFITNSPTGSFGPAFDENTDTPRTGPGPGNTWELGPGAVVGLDPGQTPEFADPNRPSGTFEPFFKAIVNQIGAALNLPPETLMLRYNESYSASRGAVLEAWKEFRAQRMRFVRNFCQPIFEEWFYEAVLNGRISAPGFLEDARMRKAYTRARWTGPGQGQLNPEVETRAALLRIDGSLTSREEERAEIKGDSWEPVAESLIEEDEILRVANRSTTTNPALLKASADASKPKEELTNA